MGADFLQTAVPSDFMKDIFIDWGRVGSMMAILVTGNHVDGPRGAHQYDPGSSERIGQL